LSKLEDLFRSGFIIEDEYAQRKTELLAQQSSAPAAEEKPKEKETDVEQGTHYTVHATGASGWYYGRRLLTCFPTHRALGEEHAGHCCQHGHTQHDTTTTTKAETTMKMMKTMMRRRSTGRYAQLSVDTRAARY
jgi:hypothetical protein